MLPPPPRPVPPRRPPPAPAPPPLVPSVGDAPSPICGLAAHIDDAAVLLYLAVLLSDEEDVPEVNLVAVDASLVVIRSVRLVESVQIEARSGVVVLGSCGVETRVNVGASGDALALSNALRAAAAEEVIDEDPAGAPPLYAASNASARTSWSHVTRAPSASFGDDIEPELDGGKKRSSVASFAFSAVNPIATSRASSATT